MTVRHLNEPQNTKLADLLLGAAKTIGVGSIIAFLYPPAGLDRSLLYLATGLIVASVLASIGLSLVKDPKLVESPRRGREKR